MDFAAIRGYRSTGAIDPNACSTLKNAQSVGFGTETYIFPCVPCGNPGGQIDAIISGLSGCPYNRIFIDVEPLQWKTIDENRKFLTTMIDTLVARKGRCDIYTSISQWSEIVGLDFTYGSKCGLWWASWDNDPSYNAFVPFSGWNQLEMKQYTGGGQICGNDLDHDYYS